MVLCVFLAMVVAAARAAAPPEGMVVGSVSQPLTAADGSEYLIFLPPTWTGEDAAHPVLLFLHGVGGINNGKGCRDPGLRTQFPPASCGRDDFREIRGGNRRRRSR